MALVGVELETLGNGARRADHSTTFEAFRLTLIKKDRQNGRNRKGRVFIEGTEL